MPSFNGMERSFAPVLASQIPTSSRQVPVAIFVPSGENLVYHGVRTNCIWINVQKKFTTFHPLCYIFLYTTNRVDDCTCIQMYW